MYAAMASGLFQPVGMIIFDGFRYYSGAKSIVLDAAS
jgi:hypothetical protein